MKKDKVKDAFLVELKRVPIVQVACEKIGISRNSVYRWRSEDPAFRKQMEEALAEGEALVNDMSESQLLSLIRDKNWSAIQFWLTRRNPKFRERLEIKTLKSEEDILTPEKEEQAKKILAYGSFIKKEKE